jgi:eukaryotic-like serine/threonine-protein kinase
MTSTASEALPVLVADLADEGARDFLEGVAFAEQVAFVPLLVPPGDRSTHMLEVYSPDSTEPLLLLADPVGPPGPEGFPLRLRIREQRTTSLRAELRRPATLRARHPTNHQLTDRHTADLEGTERPRQNADLVGRALAGGKLQIESLVGGGGVGAVYRAQHRELRIPVAVKVLHDNYQADADFGQRFHAEALAASRLDHPNVTRVLDFGQEPDGLLYLVMEFLDGVGLRSLLERDQRFDTERVVRIVSQVCAALAHAHARNVVHKDVKPENLVILQGSDDDGDPMEIVKVCDFGIAQGPHTLLGKQAGSPEEEAPRFQGTPEYMSPEQCRAESLDARSDVYSLGIVMYELVTGEVPFTNDDVGKIVWYQLNQIPDPPSTRAPNVDPRLERIIMRALTKHRDGRYSSMRDLRVALRDLLDKPPVSLSGQFMRVSLPSASAPRGDGSWGRPPSSGSNPVVTAHARPPHVSPSSPPPSSSRSAPSGWLIQGRGYGAIELDKPSSTRSELASDPTAFMRRLVGTLDAKTFAELVRPLEGAIPTLVAQLQIETLWRLASTLDMLATEGPETPGSRAAMSKTILRILRDPNTLAPIALRVLQSGDAAGVRLLVAAGSFGAHALYSARVRHGDAEARTRFVSGLREIGPAALPILRGGLERLADRLGTPGAVHIAEDLLVALPSVRDEALGGLVAAYVRSNVPSLARRAVAALPSLWRERSRALILGLLEHPSEDVAIAAMDGLAALGVTDEHTTRRIVSVLDKAPQWVVRRSAVRTLARARGEARPLSTMLLEERLRRVGTPLTAEDAEIAVDLARALMTIAHDRSAAEQAVIESSMTWPPELRTRAQAAE